MSGDAHRKRRAVLRRDGPGCHWCGAEYAPTLDHVIPRSMGGSDKIENLVLACEDCNQARGGIHGAGSFKPGEPSRKKTKNDEHVRAYLPNADYVDEVALQRKLQQLADKYKPAHERRA